MSTTTIRSDHDLQAAVQAELEWTPDIDAAGVGVSVDEGAVVLSGEVTSYSERLAAKQAALRVRGVCAAVDKLTIHPTWSVTETDIAKEVEHALTWAVNVPDTVKAEIKGHDVTLTGQARWNF